MIAGAGGGGTPSGGGAGGGDVAGPSMEWPPSGGGGPDGVRFHSGGRVPAFATGGEVPITAQPGEFVMRKSVSQGNKELLQELNATGRVKGASGGNVFLIKANDAQSFAQMLSSPASQAQLEVEVIKAIMRNGNVRNVIKNFAK